MARTTGVKPKAKTARANRAMGDGVAGRLIAAQEEAQRRIARDLQDGFQQKLATLEVDAARIVQQIEAAGEAATAAESLRARIAELSTELRRVGHQLHPSILDHVGLRAALHSFCAEFSARERIPVEFAAPEDCGPVPEETALHLYRIAHESLRNVAQHAQAKSATVSLERADGSIHLSIRDDGVGFSTADLRPAGLGLVTMRERARLIGAGFTLHSKPGHGTRIDIRMPIRRTTPKTPVAAIQPEAGPSVLTNRQREVLQLVAEGRSLKQIAGILGVSIKTVEFHKAALTARLGIHTTAELTRYAIETAMPPRSSLR